MNEYDELMEVENEVEEFESGKDYSTAIGVGAIAGGAILAYEGGKRVIKYAKIGFCKLKDTIAEHRGKKDQNAGEAEAEVPAEPEEK